MKKSAVQRILSKFSATRILVIGDLILDEYIWGKAERISPEAPVPVVWAQSHSRMPGGACNVASNAISLGAKVDLCGIIGEDANGQTLMAALKKKGVNCAGVVVDPLRPTTVKTRILAAHQQIVRLDWEKLDRLRLQQTKALIEAVRERIDAVDAVVIEDYGKGVVHPKLLASVVPLARQKKKIVTVDPKSEHFDFYKGVTAITPNEKEASGAVGVTVKRSSDIEKIGRLLLKKMKCEAVLITLGEKGMRLLKRGVVKHIPTVAQEVFDVSGAGDTVISVFTLALSCGAKMEDAAELANLAAGIVVGKVGVAVVTQEELLGAWRRTRGRAR